MSTLEKIQPIFRNIFDNEDLIVTAETTAMDVEEWDSFAQMQIVMGIEDMFSIKFSTDEVTEFKNIGDMVRAVEKYIG